MAWIEHATSPLPRECSATELHGRIPRKTTLSTLSHITASHLLPCSHREANTAVTGAGEGNRTLVVSLEGFCSTIELHPRKPVKKLSFELHLPLLVAHLQLPVLKYLDANLLLVVRSKHLDHVLPLGQDTLGDIAEDRRGLQNLVEILLQAVAPVNDGVLVRRDLEPLAELLVPNDRDVRQPLLAWNETWWGG